MKFQEVLQPRRAPGFQKSHLTRGDRQSGFVFMAGSQVKLKRTAALKKKTAAARLFISALMFQNLQRDLGLCVCIH